MFSGHKGGTKNTSILLSWALAAVATGTGFWLVRQEGDLSDTDRGYLIAAATLAAVALLFLTVIATDFVADFINFEEMHIHMVALSWGLMIAATGIWWWVYNTRLVDRNDQYLLTSAITSTIAVAFLTGSFILLREKNIPMLSRVERKIGSTMRNVMPGKKRSPGRPKKTPSRRSPGRPKKK